MTRSTKTSPLARGLGFTGMLVILGIGANLLIERGSIPNYGNWTGNLGIETKLERLRNAAAEHPIDVMIFGSSISDIGVSAKTLTEQATRATGRPVHFFNFAVGAARPSLYPKLYRLARPSAVPREIWISTGVESRSGYSSVDRELDQSPVGSALQHPFMLEVSRFFWSLPLFRDAFAIGDLALHGRPHHDQPDYGISYHPINAWGDSLYRHPCDRPYAELVQPQGVARQRIIDLTQDLGLETAPLEVLERFFGSEDLEGFNQLRSLAARDQIRFRILAIASPHDILGGIVEPKYTQARRVYYRALERYLNAESVDFLDTFHLRTAEVLDISHLNEIGAVRFSEWVAASVYHTPPPPNLWNEPALEGLLHKGGPTFNFWSDAIRRDSPERGSTLEIQLLDHRHTRDRLPQSGTALKLALRLPDNTDHFADATLRGRGTVIANFDQLPAKTYQTYVVRVLGPGPGAGAALNVPIADYRWHKDPL